MINPKRVEDKLPLLITSGSSLGWEYEANSYRLNKFKKSNPERYNFLKNNIMSNLEELHKEVNQAAEQKKLARMRQAGYSGDPKLFKASMKKPEPWRL